jgi:hypothetical protein
MIQRLDTESDDVTERQWRIRVAGEVDDQYFRVQQMARNHAHARVLLGEQLAPFLDDDCMDCRLDATAAWNRLAALEPDQPFEGYVDGNYYLIEEVP